MNIPTITQTAREAAERISRMLQDPTDRELNERRIAEVIQSACESYEQHRCVSLAVGFHPRDAEIIQGAINADKTNENPARTIP